MLDGSMTTYFHSLNFPTRVVGGVNKNRTTLKSWSSSPILSAKPLSIPLQTAGDDNSSEYGNSDVGPNPMGRGTTNPILSQANTVGIIGVSAVSTLNFLEKLIGWSLKDGKEGLPFIVCSDPVLNRKLSSQERSSFHLARSRNSFFQSDHTLIVEDLRRKKAFLERSGARCIVMPCHISHAWHNEVSDSCSVPFLHLGECVAKELKEANLKPVEAGGNVRIGILSANAKLTAGYQEKLQNQGFEVILPDKDTLEHAVIPAIEALHRKDIEGARNLLRISLQVLLVRAATRIILASNDMHGLLPQDDPLLKKCIDPVDALVRSTIKWAQSMEEPHCDT